VRCRPLHGALSLPSLMLSYSVHSLMYFHIQFRGFVFSQEPSLIYRLYRKLGPCMVSRLQGDFAFVLHDSHMVGLPSIAVHDVVITMCHVTLDSLLAYTPCMSNVCLE
jgi:hypothetical protein